MDEMKRPAARCRFPPDSWTVLDCHAPDKEETAFNAACDKRTPEERRAIGQAFSELRDAAAHRDALSEIIYYSAK
jgi:hypothetical protein